MPHFNRLSARTVASVKQPGMYADGLGLYMRVDYRDKSKQWVTAARTGEVIQATRSEFDLENRLWNRPAAPT